MLCTASKEARDIKIIKEPIKHFRGLAYFRGQAVRDIFQSVGFSGIDDTKIFSGDDRTPDLKATVKLINAIPRNWCSYTVKSGGNSCRFQGHQVWKKTYWIDCKPYNRTGFNKKNFHHINQNQQAKLKNSLTTTDIIISKSNNENKIKFHWSNEQNFDTNRQEDSQVGRDICDNSQIGNVVDS
ncbi:hypothetical protein Glove_718g63 [Diversispora epigaea]|uniref:Uncharacterized protein n=1 Tax=Diversispora epigaea TaxID=1348612 RepID=A0A397G0Q7_9GLOM|nr:hypothetical protein Glove_718g63 [Diversispora epigaea]